MGKAANIRYGFRYYRKFFLIGGLIALSFSLMVAFCATEADVNEAEGLTK